MLESVADGRPQARARAAAERLAAGVNRESAAAGVDVFLYTNGGSTYHVLVGARAAGLPLGPSAAVATLQQGYPERYARLRRALLLEGYDTHPLHGWVSAVHTDEVVDATAAAFGRAFARLRSAEGFALPVGGGS